MSKEIKEATKEETKEQTKTLQKTEDAKKVESAEELKIKKQELEEKEARLNGGFSRYLQRNYIGIDKEIEVSDHVIQLKERESELFIPLTPYWRYETDDKWLELQRKGMREELKERKKNLEKIKEQKKQILEAIPKLKERINELEKEIGQKITKFDAQ